MRTLSAPKQAAQAPLAHRSSKVSRVSFALLVLCLAAGLLPGETAYGIQDTQPPPRQALLRLFQRFVPAMSRFPKVSPDELVDDGDHIDVLGGATVLHIPGHTPGAIALHLPAEGVLLCGDAINHRGKRLGPPPASFTVDAQQAAASVKRLAVLQFEVLCPGHGEPIVVGAADMVREMAAGLD